MVSGSVLLTFHVAPLQTEAETDAAAAALAEHVGDASTWLGGTERLPGSTGLVGTSRLIRVNPPCCATQNRSSGSCMARSGYNLQLVENLAPLDSFACSTPPGT